MYEYFISYRDLTVRYIKLVTVHMGSDSKDIQCVIDEFFEVFMINRCDVDIHAVNRIKSWKEI